MGDRPTPDQEVTPLVSVPLAGPAGAGIAITDQRTTPQEFVLSPDGRSIVWELFTTNEAYLYRSPTAGPPTARAVIDALNDDPINPRVNGTNTRVVYVTHADDETDLHSVPIDRVGPSYNLTESLTAAFLDTYRFELSPDGTTVVFTATRDLPSGAQLYSTPLVPTG